MEAELTEKDTTVNTLTSAELASYYRSVSNVWECFIEIEKIIETYLAYDKAHTPYI